MNDLKVILIQCIPYAVCAVFFLTVIIRTVISVKRIRIERKTDWFSSRVVSSIPIKTILAYRMSQRPTTLSKIEVDAIKVQHEELLKSILEQKKSMLAEKRDYIKAAQERVPCILTRRSNKS